jgi:PAS domain S-box-containing protein
MNTRVGAAGINPAFGEPAHNPTMRSSSAAPSVHLPPLLGQTLAVLVLACAISLSVHISLAFPHDTGRLAPLWIANAVALATLLRAGPRDWRLIVPACLATNILTALWIGGNPATAVSLALSNMVEYGLAAVLLRRVLGPQVRMDQGRQLVALAIVAGLVGLLAAGLAATLLWAIRGDAPAASLRTWGMAHPLGLILLTPCFLVLLRPREHLRERPFTRQAGLSLALLVVCVVAVFTQDRAPLLFLIPPALLIVAIEFGAFGAATGVLLTAVIAVAATATHHGPIGLTHGDAMERAVVLQGFLIVSLLSSLPVANMQAAQRRLRADALAEANRAARAEAAALQSEARYRLLADQASDTIVTLDPQGAFTFVSPSAFTLSGYEDVDLIGRRAKDFIHPDDYPAVRQAYGALADGARGPGAPMEYRFRRRDGEWVWLEVNPRVAHDPEGRPVGFVDVARDVTERRTMEAELERAREEAEAAARAKAEFLANMSHELRTPLTSILGFTSIAAGQPDTPELVHDCIERVQNAGQALLCTVNDILDFSKLEAGQVQIVPSSCDVAELCRMTLELFTPQAAAKELDLHFESDGLASPLLVDGSRIRQILLNLIGNAVKFTEAGSVTLQVRYDGERLHMEVRDTGAGVAPEKLHLLFQRFSQIDGSLTRAHSGTGLGLAICKGLVEAMSGEIGAESQPGHGSRFWMWIPAPVAQAHEPQAAGAMADIGLDGLRVLVADDHATNRELARLFLSGFGAEVSEADDGDVAVARAAEAPYDVILMDLRMPRLDGLSALRRIRSEPGPNDATPIIAYTADANPEETTRLTGLGFDAVVSKPIELSALVTAIATALEGGVEEPAEIAHAG